jgi:hypothetical protein
MLKQRLFLLGFLLLPLCMGAQGLNPFDLQHRLPKEVLASVLKKEETGLVNPFDVVAHAAPGESGRLTNADSGTFRPLKALPRGSSMGQPFLFWAMFFLLAVLSFSIAFNRKALDRAWRSFLSNNALGIAQRETTGLVGNTPYLLLYTSFLLNAGMFLFLVARYFWGTTFNNFPFLSLCMLAAAVLFLFKHMVLQAIDKLTPAGESVQRYNFLIIIFNCILGLFLLPFNFLIAFTRQAEGFLVFWTLGLILLFYIYRAFRATTFGVRFLSGDPFHFLLYLCTVEVAPVLLLLKWAMNQGNA